MTEKPSSSLINLRPSSEDTGIKEGDSVLQVLGVTAYWGRDAETGKAIWDELGKTLTKDPSEELGEVGRLDPDQVRSAIAQAVEKSSAPHQEVDAALLVASESWNRSHQYREERLRQARSSFNWTIVCVIAGVALLAFGVLSYVLEITSLTVSKYATVVGVFTQFVSGALLFIYNRANKRLDEETNVAHELERLRLGIALLKQIHDPQVRDRALKSLIRDVLEHPSTLVLGAPTK